MAAEVTHPVHSGAGASSAASHVAGGADSSELALRECAFDDAATLAEIGRLRYAVWEGEGSVAPALFPDRCWVDAMDEAPGGGEKEAAIKMLVDSALEQQ